MKYYSKRIVGKVRVITILCCFILSIIAQGMTIIRAASKERVIRYNGKNHTYSKSAVRIGVNDKEAKTPFGGVIIDDIALIPAKYVFTMSELNTSYCFDTKKQQVILESEEHQVEIPLNKEYMYVDGKKKKLEKPAMKVYDVQMKKTSIMLPARNVSNALGFVYKWNDSSVSSNIYTKDYLEETDVSKNYTLKISKPNDMEEGAYEVYDNYWEKEFIISFQEDYMEFFEENPIEQKKDNIKSVTVKEGKNGETKILIKTSKIQGFEVTETKNALYIKTDTPQKIYDKIVVIDPGHGGSEPGAKGNSIVEKDKVLEIARYIKQHFDDNQEIKAYFTRLDNSVTGMTAGSGKIKNSQMSLAARYNFANEINPDLFISIHINSFGSSPNGTETYYSSKNTSKNDWGMTSKELANRMQSAVQEVIGRQNRGVKVNSNLAVLTHTNTPAALLEIAFLSNKVDSEILKDEYKMKELSEAIYTTIVEAFD